MFKLWANFMCDSLRDIKKLNRRVLERLESGFCIQTFISPAARCIARQQSQVMPDGELD
jgi:hypothetical protein